MGFDSKGLDDYIDVAQRIAEFRVKHPEGSLQPLNPEQPFEVRELAGTGKDGKEVRGTFIIYVAAAYRSPDDQRPGVGCAYEVFPGRTPYTAGSELQNAETAAWGRAIVAALAADTRGGVASQQEVRNCHAERDEPASRQNGSNGNGQQPAPQPVDAEAQKFADEAHKATAPREMEDIHRRTRDAGKVTSLIRNPSSGRTGKLAVYLDWRRRQVNAAVALSPDDPWAPKVEEIANAADAGPVLDEVARMLQAGEIDADRAGRIENAIIARFPDAGREELAETAMTAPSRMTPAQQKADAERRRDGRPDKAAMSNAERLRAGLMDRHQAAAHEHLAIVQCDRLAERVRGPVPDDPWDLGPEAIVAWQVILESGHWHCGGWTTDSRDGALVCGCGALLRDGPERAAG